MNDKGCRPYQPVKHRKWRDSSASIDTHLPIRPELKLKELMPIFSWDMEGTSPSASEFQLSCASR
jgi:hypothetical protein